jgi:hypothetical protein
MSISTQVQTQDPGSAGVSRSEPGGLIRLNWVYEVLRTRPKDPVRAPLKRETPRNH